MNVLMISGDPKALDPHSGVYQRLLLQESQVDRLDVYVPGAKIDVPLDGDGGVHGFSGSKIAIARAMIHAGRCLEKVDVVTAQDPFFLGFVAWRIARARGARLNLQVHADLDAQPLVKHLLAQMLLRHADSIRVVSEKLKAQVVRLGAEAPIVVLPVFVELERFTKLRDLPHRERAQKNILWIGRFEEEKDPLLAVTVLKQVREAGIDAMLTMIGMGSLEAQVAQDAAGLPVVHPGWQDTALHLASADVVLCTSRHESWGASIVEALAAGVPVVAPDVGVAREAGAHVVARDALARGVVEVLRSREQGVLKLDLPTAAQWAQRWRESLSPGRVEA